MTDQPKPDRPDGDGLPDILDRLREYAKDWRPRANSVREVKDAIAEIERLRLLVPTRDGAEGTGDPCPYCKKEMYGADDCGNCGCGSPARPTKSAPPKPAPDAMQTLIARAVCCPDGCQYEGDSEDGSKCYCDTSDYHNSGIERRTKAVLAALSVPVPPEPVAWRWQHVNDRREPRPWHYEDAPWHGNEYMQAEPLYATPPVRGDREQIARALFRNRSKFDDKTTEEWFKIYSTDPAKLGDQRMSIWRAYSDADAILVQPGAGEHCPVCHCAVCMCFLKDRKAPPSSSEGGR